MSARNSRLHHKITRASKQPSHSYALWLKIVRMPEGRPLVECRIFTMGRYGELTAAEKSVELPEAAAAGDEAQALFRHNRAELERAKAEAAKWEERLATSPLDLTDQNHVAYYTDLLPMFEEWLAEGG